MEKKQHKSYDILGALFQFSGQKTAAYIVEFIGTFFLVMTIGFNLTNPLGPFAIGSILMVMIFMGGHISGAHFNPAVTIGVRLTGRDHITTRSAFIYVIIQCVAGFLGACVSYGGSKKTFAPMPGIGTHPGTALAIEFLYTFALVSVMLNTATTKSQSANSFFGLAIGFTVLAGAFSVGEISGGAFNPAVATGPTILNCIVNGGTAKYLWLYWVAGILGGCAASMFFRLTNTKEYRKAAAIAQIQRNGEEYTPLTSDPPVEPDQM